MNYFLFAIYFALICWLLLRSRFIKQSGLETKLVLGLFFLKVAAGIAIGWLSLHFYNTGNDYWDVNREAWKEYQLLWSDPREYFTNIFRSGYPGGYAGVFDSFQSFWNDLRNNLVIKLVSLFNLFSRGDYYINSLFFNAFIFFGHVALFRVFNAIFPGKKILNILGCFLLPSTLYFSSGIHKDGVVFLLLGLLVYLVYSSLKRKHFGLLRIIMIIIFLALLFLIRNFVMIALLPALFAWLLVYKTRLHPMLGFGIVYIIGGILLFNMHLLHPNFKPLETITTKQADFRTLPYSATAIQLDSLQPNFKSFLKNMPQSLNHLLMRPYLTEIPSKTLLPLNIELLIYQLLFIMLLVFHRKSPGRADPFIYFAVFFTLTAFLFIGYIVPNLGSLVRYRSLYLPFIITPLLCGIDWKRIGNLINYKK